MRRVEPDSKVFLRRLINRIDCLETNSFRERSILTDLEDCSIIWGNSVVLHWSFFVEARTTATCENVNHKVIFQMSTLHTTCVMSKSVREGQKGEGKQKMQMLTSYSSLSRFLHHSYDFQTRHFCTSVCTLMRLIHFLQFLSFNF